jgi:DNA-binding NtrC family response regulator
MAVHVLLIDDEAEYLVAQAKLLKRRGINAATCVSGAAALHLLKDREFDVIVVDLRMPEMDGLQVIQEIRKRDEITPILLLSGRADMGGVNAALRLGAASFLYKPCAIEELVSAIEDASEKKVLMKKAEGNGSS